MQKDHMLTLVERSKCIRLIDALRQERSLASPTDNVFNIRYYNDQSINQGIQNYYLINWIKYNNTIDIDIITPEDLILFRRMLKWIQIRSDETFHTEDIILPSHVDVEKSRLFGDYVLAKTHSRLHRLEPIHVRGMN